MAFLLRNNIHHSVHPDKVNYHARIYALFKIIVKRILSTNTVGAIRTDLESADLVVPHDFVDFNKLRSLISLMVFLLRIWTYLSAFGPKLEEISEEFREVDEEVGNRGLIACTEDPRHESCGD